MAVFFDLQKLPWDMESLETKEILKCHLAEIRCFPIFAVRFWV